MRPTVETLMAFYASALGCRVTAQLLRRMTPAFATVRPSDRILGIGYASPYLAPLAGRAERIVQAMPARQGACLWPADTRNAVCLCDDQALPFPDALFDQILMVHALEYADPARRLLREAWRVLAPAGRLLVLAPNRAGIWTHFERTPFGNGRPFGRAQLTELIDDACFAVEGWETALVMPPHAPLMQLEGPARRMAPGLGGVHWLRARKSDGFGLARGEGRSVRRLAVA